VKSASRMMEIVLPFSFSGIHAGFVKGQLDRRPISVSRVFESFIEALQPKEHLRTRKGEIGYDEDCKEYWHQSVGSKP